MKTLKSLKLPFGNEGDGAGLFAREDMRFAVSLQPFCVARNG
jgi:hypothetical protein